MKLIDSIIITFTILLLIVGITSALYFLYQKHYSLSFILLIGFYSLNLILSIFLFTQNRRLNSKISWMIIFLMLPFIGHFAFLLFGQRYKFRKKPNEYFKKSNFSYEMLNDYKNQDKSIEKLFNKQSRLSKRGVYKSDFKIYDNGLRAMQSLFEDLKVAKKSIYLQFYIIKPGEVFEELKYILIKKAKEGVDVKILVDDFGRWAIPWHEINYLEKNNIKVAIFGIVNFPFIGSYNGYRLHRKSIIIDEYICHIGGLNIGDEYINMNKKYGYWIDYQVRLIGDGIRTNLLLFIDIWNDCHINKISYKNIDIKKITKTNGDIITIEDSPENEESIIEKTLIIMILNATKSIKLVTPYLIPSEGLLNAIKIAKMSGVEIDIYIPGRADKKYVLFVSEYYSNLLLEYGVNIYIGSNLFVHSKMGVFDNKIAYFGSANLDSRTLYSQWETIQIVNGHFVHKINEIFSKYNQVFIKKEISLVKRNIIKTFFTKIYVNIFTPIM